MAQTGMNMKMERITGTCKAAEVISDEPRCLVG